ncbi:hypothetical protein FA95DRAFT_1556797 [Auriscalpium vulgare]|uniref:Uncharacterized protein n=1 Tax=Auriscalpium vulgare TaxID=40419 RepID=A0ACB8RZH4_9AGAM|nr:hypothetical protein FA95DRAFT_1556797 [Auriscalpium vulgare]
MQISTSVFTLHILTFFFLLLATVHTALAVPVDAADAPVPAPALVDAVVPGAWSPLSLLSWLTASVPDTDDLPSVSRRHSHRRRHAHP